MAGDAGVYREKLAEAKAGEKPEVVLLIADDLDLTKIVVAWTHTPVRQKEEIEEGAAETPAETWAWLWRNCEFSREELLERAAVSQSAFERKFRVLVGNRIIYPDGTANSFVERYLRQKVLNLFEGRPRARAKRGER